MNYPKQQARKALLKKLIAERNDELAFLKSEIAHFVALDRTEFKPEINSIRANLKKSKRDLRVLEKLASDNKREISDNVLMGRFLKEELSFSSNF